MPHAAVTAALAAVTAAGARVIAGGRVIWVHSFPAGCARWCGARSALPALRAPRRSALAPGWLGVDDRHRAGRGRWQHLHELGARLPLEDEVRGHDVLADGVELRGPLHGL